MANPMAISMSDAGPHSVLALTGKDHSEMGTSRKCFDRVLFSDSPSEGLL